MAFCPWSADSFPPSPTPASHSSPSGRSSTSGTHSAAAVVVDVVAAAVVVVVACRLFPLSSPDLQHQIC